MHIHISAVFGLYSLGRVGVSVKDMAKIIFEEVDTFAQTNPQHLKDICVAIIQRPMFDEFVDAVEDAEKLKGHPVKKFFYDLIGIYLFYDFIIKNSREHDILKIYLKW